MTIFPTKKKCNQTFRGAVGYVEQVLSLGIGSTTEELTASLLCKRLRGQVTGTGAAAATLHGGESERVLGSHWENMSPSSPL